MQSHLRQSPTLSMNARRGFTIVELLIVIVVIAILAAITVVAYTGIQNKANDSAAISNAQQTGKKLTVYALSNGEILPADLATAGITDSGDLTYQYTPNTTVTPNTFCLTATSNGNSAHIAGTTSSVKNAVAGPCTGHTGTAPTTLADGSSCPTGYIVAPGSSLYETKAFCAMKYEAKNVGGVATSQAAGAPWVSISQTDAMTTSSAACTGCHLISEAEYLTIAHNVLSVDSNWSGGSIGSGYIYSGHNDNSPASALAASSNDGDGYAGTGNTTPSNQRRALTLTNGEVIWDIAGNVYDWTSGQTTGGQPGASGYAYRQWNDIAGTGSLSPNPHPSYGTPAASNWTTRHGIGQLYSDSTETVLRGFHRGGALDSGSYAGAGVLTLALDKSPNYVSTGIGFRVAR